MNYIKWIFIILFLSFTTYSCDKENTEESGGSKKKVGLPPLIKIEVIKGNNQVGFRNRLLPDDIYIEIMLFS